MAKFHFLAINTDPKNILQLQEMFYSVGRDLSNAIVLPSNTISRCHAYLHRQSMPGSTDYKYELVDGNSEGKASHNGVYVNQSRISAHVLNNGDIISFGGTIDAMYFVSHSLLSLDAIATMINFGITTTAPALMSPDEPTTIML